MSLGANYFSQVLDHKRDTIDKALETLQLVEFDTVVGCGISGVTFAAMLAYKLDCNLWIVRKREDVNNHSSFRVEGSTPIGYERSQVLVVDDLVATGATMVMIRETLYGADNIEGFDIVGEYMYATRRFTTEGTQSWLKNDIAHTVRKRLSTKDSSQNPTPTPVPEDPQAISALSAESFSEMTNEKYTSKAWFEPLTTEQVREIAARRECAMKLFIIALLTVAGWGLIGYAVIQQTFKVVEMSLGAVEIPSAFGLEEVKQEAERQAWEWKEKHNIPGDITHTVYGAEGSFTNTYSYEASEEEPVVTRAPVLRRTK